MTLAQAKQVLIDIQFPRTDAERALYLQALQVIAGSFVGVN